MMRVVGGCPYTAQLERNAIRETPACTIPSKSTFHDPIMLRSRKSLRAMATDIAGTTGISTRAIFVSWNAIDSGWVTATQPAINYFERDQRFSEKTLERVVPSTPSVEQTSFEDQGVDK